MESRNYSHTFRSVIFLTGGFAVGSNGLVTQRSHQRSISMSSLWAMGFGEINSDEVMYWGQPEYVSMPAMRFFFH